MAGRNRTLRPIFFAQLSCRGEENGDHTYVTDVDPGNTLIYVFGTVAFSGTYTNGTGDTVNWLSISEQLGISGQPIAASMCNPAIGPTQASPSNWVMRGYASGGTEFSTGAYPGSATGDKVVFAAQFRRLT